MRRFIFVLSILFVSLLAPLTVQAQLGLQFSGMGAVNRGIGGVAAATPVDSLGALYWNPATISALPSSEISFGVDLIRAKIATESSLQANALGPGIPVSTLAGRDESDNGWAASPSLGLIHRAEDSNFTFGLGVFGVAGFGVNYSASQTNPVLFPSEPPPGGLPGLGNVFASIEILQIAPTVALQISDSISVAIGPTISLGRLQVDPFALTGIDNSNMNAFGSYPSGTHTRFHWGGGFAGGIFMNATNDLNFGVGVRSPQWFEDFTYTGKTEVGTRRDFSTPFEYPLIVSLGTSYTGIPDTVVGMDVRYLGWSHADLYGDTATFDPDGSIHGLGWNSTWAVAMGIQRRVTDTVTARAGYTFGQSPINSDAAGFNIPSPLILEHMLSIGASIQISQPLTVHLAYTHAFQNEVGSPIQTPLGPLPGSNVKSIVSGHALTAGVTASF